MPAVEPFTINIPQEKIDRLKQKLALVDFPDELDEAGWDYGAPLGDLKRLIGHWKDGYDWRKAERALNEKLPQFTVDIPVEGFETLKIHFVHQKSENPNAIPLLFCHGWPGSFIEVQKILPEFIKVSNEHPSFHVVAPSLPNFGFSQGTKKRAWTSKQHAEVCHKLMQILGYKEYVTQGGDIGFAVTRAMGLFYPEACKASHLNMVIVDPPGFAADPDLYFEANQTPLTAAEKAGMERTKWFRKEGFGYNLEQATKPQTIGYSMTDSPLGLLAWVYEKLHDWTDNYPWNDDEVITWISIYWFSTAGPHASQRLYYESLHDKAGLSARLRGYVPDVLLGIINFPKELFISPKIWHKSLGPVVFETEYDQGGHFAAWERPDVLVGDVRKMFSKSVGGAYGIVKGLTGYPN